jgi:RNA polymerase sigma-70 factor (ECF subfamily)
MDLRAVKKSRMPLADEPQLVRQAKTGDSEAFGALYDAYLERIYRFVYFRVEDQQTAEDITSQVFLKAWENLGRFHIGGAPFLAWLYTIAHNAVIDYYRTRKVTAALDDVRLSDPGHAEVVENGIDSAVEMDSIKIALQTLTDDQRQVLLLKFIDEMSNEEIARHLGKREGAIRALQMRGLKALAKRLAEKINYEQREPV